jgi:hypothetical protein
MRDMVQEVRFFTDGLRDKESPGTEDIVRN